MSSYEAMIPSGASLVAPALRTRAYAKAVRHSLLVRFLKVFIPVGSVVGVAAVVAIALFNPFARVAGLTLGPVSLSGTHVTMESPRLRGYRRDAQPYDVTATAATQDVRKPNLVELKELRAKLAMDDKGGTARLEAVSGTFDTHKEMLELREQVRIDSDAGHAVRMTSAVIDLKAGTVVSNEPVTVTLTNGKIDAAGVDVSDGGRVLHFRGRVRTVFENITEPQATAPGPARTTQAEPASPTR
jgi:lipopolysaccharide export system protein LptC